MHPPPAPLEPKGVWQECWRQPKEQRDKSYASFIIVVVTAKERLQTETAVERLQHHRPLFRGGGHGPPAPLDPPVLGMTSSYWLCEDSLINLGASVEECRNKRLH